MKIRTDYWAKPGMSRQYDWSAIDDDTYDGAPDSATRNQVGYGATEAEAIADLEACLAYASTNCRYACGAWPQCGCDVQPLPGRPA